MMIEEAGRQRQRELDYARRLAERKLEKSQIAKRLWGKLGQAGRRQMVFGRPF